MLGLSPWCPAQSSPQSTTSPGETQPVDGPADWPRQFASGKTQFTIYQPQLDSWDGHALAARSAVAVKDESDKNPTYGTIWIEGRTSVDKTSRMVTLDQLTVTKMSFPTRAKQVADYQRALDDNLHDVIREMALDRLHEQLEIMRAAETGYAVPVRNDPPEIVFATVPAILVTIDGEPVFKSVPDTELDRAINTRVLLLKDHEDRLYLHVFDGWMKATRLDGEWTVDEQPSRALSDAQTEVLKAGNIDLLTGGNPDSSDQPVDDHQGDGGGQAQQQDLPSLSKGPVPKILIATKPTELIVTDGAPDYVPIDGTDLLYVKNSSADIFKDTDDQQAYIRISGRWFRAASNDGPWTFVEGKDLPDDFANIPDDSDKENVKASVPGTSQAQEALIANSIPQTATVKIDDARMSQPQYDGDPRFEPIKGTDLHYVVNASAPVIEVSEIAFYSVENGVWFTSGSVHGPWRAATSVPAEIYKIPQSSPLHYLTYVYVYDATDDTVYVGYTPGYSGTVVHQNIVVYGTGYYCRPWIGAYWWGCPATYGYGASLFWTPWGGWGFGFGFGWGWGAWGGPWGWGWGPGPFWGPWHWHGGYWGHHYGWGPRGRGGYPNNYYHRWGSAATNRAVANRVGVTPQPNVNARGATFNSVTGKTTNGERGAVTSRSDSLQRTDQSTRASTTRNNVYADHSGNVYRRQDSGQWQQHSSGDWNNVERSNISRSRPVGSNFAGAGLGSSGFGGGGFESRGFNAGSAFGARMSGMSRVGGFRRAGGFGGGMRTRMRR